MMKGIFFKGNVCTCYASYQRLIDGGIDLEYINYRFNRPAVQTPDVVLCRFLRRQAFPPK